MDSIKKNELFLNNSELNKINKKILADGEHLPAIKLKDGLQVQTGTVAAMLHNIRLYNKGERGDIEKELEAAIPTLAKIGLFELFTPDEWLNETNPGKYFLGLKAKAYLLNPEKFISHTKK